MPSKGIEADRLTAKGYGESTPVNHCVDGVNCTEEEHQANRRTEFKIIRIDESLPDRGKDLFKLKNGDRILLKELDSNFFDDCF